MVGGTHPVPGAPLPRFHNENASHTSSHPIPLTLT
jgi:hypothetical protein